MKRAFILINTALDTEFEVRRALKEIPEVKETYTIHGIYDIIARVETETMQKLKDTINSSIRELDNIRSVITLICMDEKES